MRPLYVHVEGGQVSSRTVLSGDARVCGWRLEYKQAWVRAQFAAGLACDPISAGDAGLRPPLSRWGAVTVEDVALGLEFRLSAVALCCLWREPEAAGEGAVVSGAGGVGVRVP